MIQLVDIIHNSRTSAFLSFLIGFGLMVLLFHKPFQVKQGLSLPVSKIEGRVVRHGDKCYSYQAKDSLCPLVNKDGRGSN